MKIEDFLDNYLDNIIVDEENEQFYFEYNDVKVILLDLLSLAAENAEIKTNDESTSLVVDKDSILNTLTDG